MELDAENTPVKPIPDEAAGESFPSAAAAPDITTAEPEPGPHGRQAVEAAATRDSMRAAGEGEVVDEAGPAEDVGKLSRGRRSHSRTTLYIFFAIL
jgi:hypothetical protein